MRRLADKGPHLLLLVLGVAAVTILINSSRFIASNYYVPLFWDEWVFGLFFSRPHSVGEYVREMFTAHNEHVIAPTKLLFIINGHFFRLTNLPLVAAYVCLTFATSALMTRLVLHERRDAMVRTGAWLVFAAALLSRVQWENLLWGFQSQFQTVLIGALVSIILAITLVGRPTFSLPLTICLYLAVGLCIFSSGNGVLIPISVLFVLVTCRASRWQIAAFCIVSVAYLLTFGWLTRGGSPVGDPALKTASNLVRFFFTVIGGPLTPAVETALMLGACLVAVCAGLFVITVMIPLMRSRPVDRGLLGLFAFLGFLLGTAAGAAWARTSLGIWAALASRYATPMLMLWMTVFGLLLRFWVLRTRPGPWRPAGAQGILLAALALVAWTDLRRDLPETVAAVVAPIEQAAYFVASDALADTQLAQLYPNPSEIRATLAFLREHQMNLFAPSIGLPVPDATDLKAATSVASDAYCATARIDKIARLGADIWTVSGWAADDRLRTPKWVLSLDSGQRVAGFTAPLVPRPDIAATIHAETGFKGFSVPVRLADPASRHAALVVISRNGQVCRLRHFETLPAGLLPVAVQPQPLRPIDGKVSVKGSVTSPGLPEGVVIAGPYPGAKAFGTGAAADEDVGEITLDVPDPTCRGFLLPVLRGPSARGQVLEIRYPGGAGEEAALDSLSRHTWGFFKIGPSEPCQPSPTNVVRVVLKDEGRGWGEWSAVASPVQLK